MRNFESLKITKKGADIIQLASKKAGILLTTKERLEEVTMDSIAYNMSKEAKEFLVTENTKIIDSIENSINFLECITNNLSNSEEYVLSLTELNFLTNNKVISYE